MPTPRETDGSKCFSFEGIDALQLEADHNEEVGRGASLSGLLDSSASPARRSSFRWHGRAGELFLLLHFARLVLLHWRIRAEPLETLALVVHLGAPVMSRADRGALADALAEANEDESPEPPQTIAILVAASRWFCRLNLNW
jgi:hypothetical protein